MALTRLGFTGTQAAYGTFSDKSPRVSVGQRPRASRYRYEYRVSTVIRMFVLFVVGGLS